MSIIFVLIPLAVIIVAIAIGVFFWAVKSNQFDDLERQGYSILFDDDITPNNTKDNKTVSDKAESSETVESNKQNTKEPKH
ncbi:cbb3-type cytochrome oxidase assembly protein CcoS [Glaciecola petra]|uniref:Cbb3-type cytochrome oxidase assembly protein CcoS n=1 Tax=Glaciecola petra TaxID=3075602 RepID=A0ABU2ZNQ1_9ALTE|nr:cbb3-type cytochrome oxidase assembly protein CcoS [Aestuariibacter sp. P117]MDT0594254.1 cbb3-type cytochrome oxidase assembly protein CcoS [Aestuariibacter sp. P117]